MKRRKLPPPVHVPSIPLPAGSTTWSLICSLVAQIRFAVPDLMKRHQQANSDHKIHGESFGDGELPSIVPRVDAAIDTLTSPRMALYSESRKRGDLSTTIPEPEPTDDERTTPVRPQTVMRHLADRLDNVPAITENVADLTDAQLLASISLLAESTVLLRQLGDNLRQEVYYNVEFWIDVWSR